MQQDGNWNEIPILHSLGDLTWDHPKESSVHCHGATSLDEMSYFHKQLVLYSLSTKGIDALFTLQFKFQLVWNIQDRNTPCNVG